MPRKQKEIAYDAAYYENAFRRRHWFRDNDAKYEQRQRAVLRMVQPEPSDRVLDVGCATGDQAFMLAPNVECVLGIDSSAAAVRAARSRAAAHPNVAFVQADAARIPLPDASFDKVMAIDFVEHIDDSALDAVQREVWRILRPGGVLAIYTPCACHYVERLKARNFILEQVPGHIAVRDRGQYETIFAALPWRIAQCFSLPSTYPLFGRLDQILARWPLFHFRLCMSLERVKSA
jgi:ubiquinone/menaquinone biosynthesis C-methylase UbiE